MKVRKLKQKESTKTEEVVSKESIPAAGVANEAPSQVVLEPLVLEVQTSSEGPAEEAPVPTAAHLPEPIDISSPKAEFSLRIGSLDAARRSMVIGYLTLILLPAIVVLLIISQVDAQSSLGARRFQASLESMLWAIAMLGVPMVAVSWFHGFYPRGSLSRFVSGSVFAFLFGLWLALILIASDVQGAVAESGVALKLNWLLVVVCLTSVFVFARAASELLDDRRPWRKKMGAENKKIILQLGSRFVDFNYHIGRYKKGISSAWMAYVNYIVIPTTALVLIDYGLSGLNLEAKALLVHSVGSMFGIVVLFGGILVLVRFMRAFYPLGSLSRASFGLATIPILILYAWEILVGSGVEAELAQNKFIIDMELLMLPVFMHVSFTAVFELSELKDGRRAYRRWLGLPVTIYDPGEKYNRLNDFDTFYASFATGTRKARRVLSKYVFEIMAVIVLVAIGVSVYGYPNSMGLSEDLRSYLNPPVLDRQMDNMILTLLGLAIACTVGVFLASSYVEGSFSRLVLSGVVAVFASQWAYYFWSSLAKMIQPKEVTILDTGITLDRVIYAVMFLFFGLIVFRAVRQVYRWYLLSRNKFVDWRLNRLRMEAVAGSAASGPIIPPAPAPSPKPLVAETPWPSPAPSSSSFFPERAIPSQARPLTASFSFDVSSAGQDSPKVVSASSGPNESGQEAARPKPVIGPESSPEGIMARYMALTSMPASKVIQRATEHFGPRSGGLMVKSKTDNSLCLEGPDGSVTISVCPSKFKAKRNEVDIATDQFEKKVKEFLAEL